MRQDEELNDQRSELTPDDVGQLRNEVYGAGVPYCTQVAHRAAEYRHRDIIDNLPDEIAQLAIWRRYVSPSWQ